MKITLSDSAYQRTQLLRFAAPIYKNIEFLYYLFLPEERSQMPFFYMDNFIGPMALEHRERAHLNIK